jgi:hypothetical protein
VSSSTHLSSRLLLFSSWLLLLLSVKYICKNKRKKSDFDRFLCAQYQNLILIKSLNLFFFFLMMTKHQIYLRSITSLSIKYLSMNDFIWNSSAASDLFKYTPYLQWLLIIIYQILKYFDYIWLEKH